MFTKSKIAMLICMTAYTTTGLADSKSSRPHECVVLIHGLGRTAFSMKRLEWNLSRQGYEVINVSYPSRRFSVEHLAEKYLHKTLVEKSTLASGKVHFITHSMGAIILRSYLSNHTMTNLGRVIMLAPPNQGSELADALKRRSIGRWILGPGGCELGTARTDAPKSMGAVDFAPGIIAGNRSCNPWFSRFLPRPNDGKVSVESAKVEGMKDFLVVESSHTWMMWRAKTIQPVSAFLQNGRFPARFP